MKKTNYCQQHIRRLKKILLIMKITMIFMLVCSLQVSANLYAQTKRFDLTMNDVSVKEVLRMLEAQSDFRFFYNDELSDVNRLVSIDMKDLPIDEILFKLFDQTKISYKVLENNLIVISPANLMNQQQKITGTISDASTNEAIAGANVRIEGTNIGAISDSDGKFSLEVPVPNAVLVVSFMGFNTEKMIWNGQTNMVITLIPNIQELEEVVVVGYTSTTKKNVASSMAVVNSNELLGLSTTDVRQTIQGKIAGVQVLNNSGDPGAGARIVIRGVGSFSDPDPLYVIDGIQGGDINTIPPQDIQSITVLKDASSTAIYGSAAANGVVIITTKKGKSGSVKVNYDGSMGFSQVPKRYNLLNASQYVDLVGDIQKNNGQTLTPKLLSPDVRVDRTDWQEAILRNAPVSEHNLMLSGGSENMTYLFATGYQDQKSTIIDQNFQRFTLGSKLTEDLFKRKVRLSQNLRLKNDITTGSVAGFLGAIRMPPYIPVHDSTNLGGYGRSDKVTDLNDANNPYNDVYNSPFKSKSLWIELDLSGEVDIIKGLIFKTQGRISTGNFHSLQWNNPSNGGNAIRSTADMNENYNYSYHLLWENFFSYDKAFGIHNISAVAGNTYSPADEYRQVSVGGSDYTSGVIHNVALANQTSVTGETVNSGKSRLSYFGRLGYTLNERYVVNASIRRDASSVFGQNNRWGTFYGVGLAWTITKENFMSSLPAISNLKLRTSYGKTGNDNILPFLTSASVWKGQSNNIVYSFGDDGSTFAYGSTVNGLANPDLKWEETTQFDLGLDLGLFNNKINLIVDYYNRSNKDLLIQTQLPASTGLGLPGQSPTQWVNAASMKNNGIEVAVSYGNNSKVIKWDVSVNATYSTNEVTALGTLGNTPISKGEFEGGIGNSTRTDIGHPLGSFYGYKFDHVAVDQAEVDQLNARISEASGGAVTTYQTGLKPGDRLWKDADGNGYIDDKDRTYIGNPSPKWQFGAIFNAAYKNLDFQFMLQGVAGVDIANGNQFELAGMSKPFNSTTDVLRRWRNPGDVTDIPAAGQDPLSNLAFSDWYVENGSYLKVKNIVLGYTLPHTMFKSVIEKFRIYIAVQNAFTMTNYSGLDPEISTYAPTNNDTYVFVRGVDFFQNPNPRIYRVGVQLNF
jgi:TonB-dependent starch-binding outer membrane protein SusC